MSTFADYLTILQLGVGLNLVTGAYASHRKDFEEKVEEQLDRYREHMERLLKQDAPEQGPICHDLQNKPAKELSNRELSRSLGDASIRFHRRAHRFDRRDGAIEKVLLPIGLACAVALVVASVWPGEFIAPWLALVLSFAVLAPPLFAFVRTSLELKEHQWHYRREVNESYAEAVEGRHDERMRSKARKGEIHRIANQIRTRVKRLP